MDLSEFDFDLPPDRIAQHPARPRDSARLLAVGPALADRQVRDLAELLAPGDVLVSNDTRVIAAQLTARRGAARIGITLDRALPDGTWHALARNARRLRPGDELRFEPAAGAPPAPELVATVQERTPGGGVILAFAQAGAPLTGAAFAAALRGAGQLALPPYIARPAGPTPQDAADYQTVFARTEGAVAAPTAGLHFTPDLLAALDARGVRRVTLTLHVGAGTFLPVREDDVTRHRMHAERGEITRRGGRGDQRRARRRRPGGRGRHHRAAPAGDRRRPGRHAPPLRRRDGAVHPARLPVPRGRSVDDQFPFAALDPVHAGVCVCRHGADAGGVCACDRNRISVLFLWGCIPA